MTDTFLVKRAERIGWMVEVHGVVVACFEDAERTSRWLTRYMQELEGHTEPPAVPVAPADTDPISQPVVMPSLLQKLARGR